ncbi:MAG TPA: ADOP family duplicated permease [Vicinamibacterales bacterium]|nr:ADOP family duplicated permease [Vicinamibacterales bacterium]
MFARLRSLARALTSRGDFETGLTEELRFHIEQYAEDRVRSGLSPEEARRRARMELGGINTVKEECREARGLWGFDALERNCRYAVRQLRRNPGFAGTVILTLALAVGANTASFSLLNALLLKALPYAHPERIGTLYARTSGPEPSDRRRTVDGEQWEHVRADVPSLLSAVSAMRVSGVNVRVGSVVQYVQTGRVSARYFNVLAIDPLIGRNFSEDEDRPHGPKTAILSYRLWRTALGGQPSVLGQTVLLKGEPHTIIGVLPEGATTPLNADVYTALQPSREGEGQAANFVAIMRLRDDATWQQADAELGRALSGTVRARRFASTNPGAQVTYYAVPLQKAATDALRPQVLTLMLATGSILLIACANIAGLTLVRMRQRTGEITIRLALGASAWQVQRQLWVEHLLLACLGATAGIGVGLLALRGLLRLVPERVLTVATVPLDGRVLAFTLSLSLLTYVLSGVLPVLSSKQWDLRSSASGRGVIGGGSLRLRQALIAGEVALTAVLLAATGLLIRTLIGLQTIPPGFNPTGVITAKASLDDVRYHDPAAFRKLLTDSLTALRETPGVQSAAVGLTLPYERALLNAVTLDDGKEAGRQITTNQVYVTPRYFETLQIAVLAGRTFTDADNADAQHVVVVNQTFARKFLHQEDAVGRYLNTNVLIVGVVADTVLSSAAGLNAGAAPLTREETIYVPAAQVDAKQLSLVHGFFQPSWIVRSASPSGVPAQVQRALASADPQLPVSGFYGMSDLMAATLATHRIAVAILAGISSLALLLSAVGIFALVANIVAQRRREIGIRMALGSTIGETMIQVGRAGVGASALGLGLGLILCAGALPPMRSVLFGVDVYDAPTMLTVVLTLGAVTLLATTPILRVARIDPAKTLREE